MSRFVVLVERHEDCFPRVSRDEPQCKYQAIMRQQFSPRERG